MASKIIIRLLFFLVVISCMPPKSAKTSANDLEKWKKAVVHLECATNSKSLEVGMQEYKEIGRLHEQNLISDEEYVKRATRALAGRDIRFQGTAIFYQENNKRYLLTARHVVWDEIEANRILETSKKTHPNRPMLLEEAQKNANHRIFDMIYLVPSLDEVLRDTTRLPLTSFLMNLNAGGGSQHTFSDPNIDLAVISLDDDPGFNKLFVNELTRKGYIPIGPNDINLEPSFPGQDVASVGFPGATSILAQLHLREDQKIWASDFISIPIFAFGKVSMLHPKLNFFWADISLYPGNSGGPVIANNKLVGIVSAQAYIPVEGGVNMFARIPFAKIIKSKHINELIKIRNVENQENQK